MGLVKHKSSTEAKVDVKDIEKLEKQFLLDINNVTQIDEIPADLIINFDQTRNKQCASVMLDHGEGE